MSANVTTLPRPCKPWEKADDCAWNVKTARIVLLPFQISFFFFSLFIAFKILNRNRFWGKIVAPTGNTTLISIIDYPCFLAISMTHLLLCSVVSRPVLCMVLVTVSMFFDILE